MVDERYGYYECSICGHKSQVLVENGTVDTYDEDGNFIGQEVAYDVDYQASFDLACEHEEIHN